MSGGTLLLMVGLTVAQVTENDLQQRAEAAFAEGVQLRDQPARARVLFRRAAELYEQLRHQGCDNPDLYWSQGNAYYLADDLPLAIQSYRRGLRLDPTHRGLQVHLQVARERVHQAAPTGFGKPPIEQRPPWLPRLRLTVWTAVPLLLGYTLSCLCCARWGMTRRWPWLLSGTVGLLAAASLSGAFYLELRAEENERRYPLVVLADEGVLLRKGNGLEYPVRSESPLPRGAEARLRYERAGWVQIELSDGTVGWVPREYVLIDRTE